jgi:hypothetical protein
MNLYVLTAFVCADTPKHRMPRTMNVSTAVTLKPTGYFCFPEI